MTFNFGCGSGSGDGSGSGYGSGYGYGYGYGYGSGYGSGNGRKLKACDSEPLFTALILARHAATAEAARCLKPVRRKQPTTKL